MFDFLQVHDSRPMTEWELRCIAQLKSLLIKQDTYTMIELPLYPTLTETVNHSDIVRGEWLSKHSNGFYVDTDCFLCSRYTPIHRGIVHLPRNANAVDGDSPDIFLICVNGDSSWIKRNFNSNVRNVWIKRNVEKDLQSKFYGFPLAVTKSWAGYRFIPDSIYQHTYQTMHHELDTRVQNKGRDMSAGNGQTNRHINDVVNEQIVAFDGACSAMKIFMGQLRDGFNSVSDRVASLEKAAQKSTVDGDTKKLLIVKE
jgi:hypothetical protein